MKTAQEIKAEFFVVLWELQNTNPEENIKRYLQNRLNVLFWVLGDEVADEYGEQVEKILND